MQSWEEQQAVVIMLWFATMNSYYYCTLKMFRTWYPCLQFTVQLTQQCVCDCLFLLAACMSRPTVFHRYRSQLWERGRGPPHSQHHWQPLHHLHMSGKMHWFHILLCQVSCKADSLVAGWMTLHCSFLGTAPDYPFGLTGHKMTSLSTDSDISKADYWATVWCFLSEHCERFATPQQDFEMHVLDMMCSDKWRVNWLILALN